jgi:hypothetical protein
MSLETAIKEAEQLLADAAESVIRMVLVGWTLGRAASLPAMNKDETPGAIHVTKVQEMARSTA